MYTDEKEEPMAQECYFVILDTVVDLERLFIFIYF
jgi:hypothetical protein